VTPNELLELKNTDGDNVAHVAAEHNHSNIIQRLSEIDPAIFTLRNDQGFTTAGVACKHARIKVLQWMLINVASVSTELEPRVETNFNTNLLFVSIMFHQADCCLWLCSEFKRRGLDINQQNSRKLAAIHMAAKFGSLHCLQILVSSGANIHTIDDTGRNAAQIAHESGQKLILGYLALAESCFQLAQQLLQVTNVVKDDKETQTEEALKEIEPGVNMTPITESTPNVKRTQPQRPDDDDVDEVDIEMVEILEQGKTLVKPPSLSPISNASFGLSEADQRQSDSRCYSASFLYADSILSEVPNCSNDYCRTFLDHSSLLDSSKSVAASNIFPHHHHRGIISSPTVSNCTNEPQIESKEQMRARMARVSAVINGPKLVSPKRTLGSGPVLVGKLEPVEENETMSSHSRQTHSRLDSTLSEASISLRKKSKDKLEHHRRTVHGVMEIVSKHRQTAVVNPTLKGLDYLPQSSLSNSTGGSLNNLLDISIDSKEHSERNERHHSAGSQTLSKINQIKIEPELNKKQIKDGSKTISFSKRARNEWRKLFTK